MSNQTENETNPTTTNAPNPDLVAAIADELERRALRQREVERQAIAAIEDGIAQSVRESDNYPLICWALQKFGPDVTPNDLIDHAEDLIAKSGQA
jgi:hypothetical protein